MSKNSEIKNKRNASLEKLKRKPVLLIDNITGDIFGKISSDLFKANKQTKYRIQDLWLASQCIQHNYKFLTENKKDFEDIPGLDLVTFVRTQY